MPRLLAAAAAAACILVAGCDGSDGAPPPDFIGIVSEDLYAGSADYRRRTIARQSEAGIGLIRQRFDWAQIELAPGEYDFSRLDGYVATAAERGIRILPILFNPPPFESSAPARDAERGTYPPRRPAAMARFAAAAARRYGPDGTLWDERPNVPKTPIRDWQVWNEPNLPVYWAPRPDAAAYARLLEVVRRALRRVDRDARVVVGGITNSTHGVPLVDFLTALVATGGRRAFDLVGIHPYAPTPDAALALVEQTRDLLDTAGGENTPIWVTEVGWASSGPDSPFTVTPQRQAEYVHEFLTEAAARHDELGLLGVVYYNWRDARPPPGGIDFFGLYTGLLRLDGTPKPALDAVRDASEQLRSGA